MELESAYAEIAIGGQLTPGGARRLAAIVVESSLCEQDSGRALNMDTAVQAIEYAADHGEPLKLFNFRALYADITEVREVCEMLGLCYLQRNEPTADTDAGYVYYSPVDGELLLSCDVHGELVLNVSDLWEFLRPAITDKNPEIFDTLQWLFENYTLPEVPPISLHTD
jgi:hypothetical protein